ncbi:uncharacterized protein EI90DRAFT_2967001 [Cantharellus anzutake]|uniref:uncharacterized protein n=1 Tax=Cantharellus anzutake TaxID=1750568 RepID=UPI001903961D|nr:uncharacterized protein EI90DRAFT_2967001 [Cantharellus anzutake]KAF8339814.1 hypothetical protein EI90DRAFT_2967001 [Cantharellus anzutake]
MSLRLRRRAMHLNAPPLFLLALSLFVHADAQNGSMALFRPIRLNQSPNWSGGALHVGLPDDKCPPCFNCLLPAFTCGQYGECNPYDGQCRCPPGFGGIDCMTPLCGALADGDHRYPRPEGEECECKDGWGGINCNVCQTDEACLGFPVGNINFKTNANGEPDFNMTCYKGGETVRENFQMCDVTNRKILDMLPGRPPQVSFNCEKDGGTCAFQFWIGKVESFYCALDNCTTSAEIGYNQNITNSACDHIKCSCIPGKMLCGEEGSIDISDFLTEEIKGPAFFKCKTGSGCSFEEPAMNQLINDVFGDSYITLNCDGGECLHYTQVPGYHKPTRPSNGPLVALSAAGAGLIFIIATAAFWYLGRTHSDPDSLGSIRLPTDEASRLMTDHVPASLRFQGLTYQLDHRTLLDGITGHVCPGQVMAIMGASGAGKSTLLDILARKQKKGSVSGDILVNGRYVSDDAFRKVMGFVDQEDTLMSTLTVYETVLYSALLRLPREMSFEAKKFRTLETLHELGILSIKDSRIGETGKRSISGGEKRRVSIACELVTSPSILFLDEPTSGLDSFNAFNVVECLVTLARDFRRTVVFTIHQPRSNIVAMFDQLVLLAKGRMVYSGELSKCHPYLERIGHPCPPGFNLADYLIDVTMQSEAPSPVTGAQSPDVEVTDVESNIADEERAPRGASSANSHSHPSHSSHTRVAPEEESHHSGQNTPYEGPSNVVKDAKHFLKRKTSQLLDVISAGSGKGDRTPPLSPRLAALVRAFAESDVLSEIDADIEAVKQRPDQVGEPDAIHLREALDDSSNIRGRRRASYTTQFRILSGRAFKNLYRNPALLTAHYISSITVALICGSLFRNVTNDIPGFQNRLGVFFFALALFGFSCLSSLGLFANERVLFIRERANGYYSSFTYFASKVLFDILPLRVVPPLVFGGITYGLIGLVPTVVAYWKFQLTLVLFNLTTASLIFFISVAFANINVGSLIGTLIMLFNLLFAGLLINRDTMSPLISWVHNISFFHAAFEALAVNELRYLQLKEVKYGVELDVPAATILSMFGLRAQAFWFPDITLLLILFGITLFASFIVLHYFVREQR